MGNNASRLWAPLWGDSDHSSSANTETVTGNFLRITINRRRDSVMSGRTVRSVDHISTSQAQEDKQAAIAHIRSLAPPTAPRFAVKDNKYTTLIGLRDMEKTWLTLDDAYLDYYFVRCRLMDNKKEEVIEIEDSERVNAAVTELLNLVADSLANAHPKVFEILNWRGREVIRNKATGDWFPLQPKGCQPQALEAAARLAMEDFNILMKEDSDLDAALKSPHYYLVASATLFPAGRRLQEHFDWAVTELHEPISDWSVKLSDPVDQWVPNASRSKGACSLPTFFSRVTAEKPYERDVYFIQVVPRSQPAISVETLFIQNSFDFVRRGMPITPSRVVIRRERQTFRRLPNTKAVVFSVRTFVHRLTELGTEDLKGLASHIRSWPKETAKFKRVDAWGETVLRYCDDAVSTRK